VVKAVFVTNCLFLESFSFTRAHGRRFLVRAHHGSFKQSPFGKSVTLKNFENNHKDFDSPPLSALIVMPPVSSIHPLFTCNGDHALLRYDVINFAMCSPVQSLLVGNSSILRCYVTSR